MSADRLDCLIVGAGPAGLTAATYLARFHRRIALVSLGPSRARYIPVSHNCPGFPFGLSGTDLLDKLTAQAVQFGVKVIEARVQRLERSPEGIVAHADRHTWNTSCVLLATGIVDRLPPVTHIEKGIADAVVRICAVCDGYEAHDHRIAVYGPPARVIQHACFLRTYSHKVTAVLSGPGQLSQKDLALAASLDIVVRQPPSIIRMVRNDDRKTTGCEILWPEGSEMFDSFYPVLGADAKAGLATALGAKVDDDGELLVDANLQTSIHGIYAAGDVVSALNQISVAVGHAAIAASAIHRRLGTNAL